MRAIPIACIFFCSNFPITRIIAALTPDARMLYQLDILTILPVKRFGLEILSEERVTIIMDVIT